MCDNYQFNISSERNLNKEKKKSKYDQIEFLTIGSDINAININYNNKIDKQSKRKRKIRNYVAKKF